jgi:hypothetical protein
MHGYRKEDPALERLRAPTRNAAAMEKLLRLAPDAFAASAHSHTFAQLVSLLSTAVLNMDAAVVGKVLPIAAAIGVTATSASTVPPRTLPGLAAIQCCRQWPREHMVRALDVLRLFVEVTPVATVNSA